ncbi:MAG TPA: zinc ribbon domain-containing protein [Candidatus Dormibacteraeota bacterium]|nr:zinc ribbon domain-containing protein [Candidatus Dormibacteraeota bacterium]
MPIYEYRCPRCGTRFEKLLAMNADRPSCPSCGARDPERRVSLIASFGCGCGSSCGSGAFT